MCWPLSKDLCFRFDAGTTQRILTNESDSDDWFISGGKEYTVSAPLKISFDDGEEKHDNIFNKVPLSPAPVAKIKISIGPPRGDERSVANKFDEEEGARAPRTQQQQLTGGGNVSSGGGGGGGRDGDGGERSEDASFIDQQSFRIDHVAGGRGGRGDFQDEQDHQQGSLQKSSALFEFRRRRRNQSVEQRVRGDLRARNVSSTNGSQFEIPVSTTADSRRDGEEQEVRERDAQQMLALLLTIVCVKGGGGGGEEKTAASQPTISSDYIDSNVDTGSREEVRTRDDNVL